MTLTHQQALGSIPTGDSTREIADRIEVIDALYRFAYGRDLKDRELFLSAFAPDAEFDFRPTAAKIGLELPLMTGRDMIAAIVLNPDVHLDTTHAVTNCRVQVGPTTARLHALVEAQHLPSADHSRHLLLKNIYTVDLVRDAGRWQMHRVHIDNIWYTGDPQVLLGQ